MIEEHQSPYFKNESEVLQHYESWRKEHAMVYKALQKLGVISKTRSVFSEFSKSFPSTKIKHIAGRKDSELNTRAIRFESMFYGYILQYKNGLDLIDERFIRGFERRGRSIYSLEEGFKHIRENLDDDMRRRKSLRKTGREAGLSPLELTVWCIREKDQRKEPPKFTEIAKKLKNDPNTCRTAFNRAKIKMKNMEK